MSEIIEGEQPEDREGEKGKEVRILQWNVWHKANPEAVLAHLKAACEEEAADIVCLQEFNGDREDSKGRRLTEVFAEELGMPNVVTSPARHLDFRGKPYSADDIAIFTRFPIENSKSQVLTADGWKVFSEREPSQNYLEAEVSIPGTDKTLTVATTHLLTPLFTKRKQRIAEADTLVKLAEAKKDSPYVLLGDFNAEPSSYAAQKVAGVLNASREPGIPTWTSSNWKSMKLWNRFLGPHKKEYDYTFVSPKVEVDSTRVLDAGPSDHVPILTVIKL